MTDNSWFNTNGFFGMMDDVPETSQEHSRISQSEPRRLKTNRPKPRSIKIAEDNNLPQDQLSSPIASVHRKSSISKSPPPKVKYRKSLNEDSHVAREESFKTRASDPFQPRKSRGNSVDKSSSSSQSPPPPKHLQTSSSLPTELPPSQQRRSRNSGDNMLTNKESSHSPPSSQASYSPPPRDGLLIHSYSMPSSEQPSKTNKLRVRTIQRRPPPSPNGKNSSISPNGKNGSISPSTTNQARHPPLSPSKPPPSPIQAAFKQGFSRVSCSLKKQPDNSERSRIDSNDSVGTVGRNQVDSTGSLNPGGLRMLGRNRMDSLDENQSFRMNDEDDEDDEQRRKTTGEIKERNYSSMPRTTKDNETMKKKTEKIRQLVNSRKQEDFERSMSRNREGESQIRTPVPSSPSRKNSRIKRASSEVETKEKFRTESWIHMNRPEIDRKSLKVETVLDDRHSKRCVRCVSWKKEKFALKISARGSKNARALSTQNEKDIMVALDSDWHTKLINTYLNDNNLFMLFEYAPNKSLDMYVKPHVGLKESAGVGVSFYIGCILNGLEFMHERGIIHRDIKIANFLIGKDGYAKICDYGLSKFLTQGERTKTFLGTMQYVSPEMLGSGGYEHAVDLWSLAISLYELILGITPFEPTDPELLEDDWMLQTQQNIRTASLHFPNERPRLGMPEKLFLKQMLDKRTSARLGYGDKVWNYDDIRKHAFFSKLDWKKLSLKHLTPPKIHLYEKPTNIFEL